MAGSPTATSACCSSAADANDGIRAFPLSSATAFLRLDAESAAQGLHVIGDRHGAAVCRVSCDVPIEVTARVGIWGDVEHAVSPIRLNIGPHRSCAVVVLKKE